MFFGVYAIIVNLKSRVNKLFLYLTTAMSIWAFTFSISNSAPTADSSIFWRCMSASGWGTFYSILLHFVLIFTKSKVLLNKRITLIMIYLPALINIILFAPFGFIAEKQYQMVQTKWGWANVTPLDISGIWLIAYCGIFSIASVLLLVRWWLKIEANTLLKRQATSLIISVLVPFFLGMTTETLPDILGTGSSPELLILFLMVPVTTLFIASKKFGLLLEKQRETPPYIKTSTPTERDRLRMFQTAAVIFLLGASLFFLAGFLDINRALEYKLLLATFVFAVGMFSLFIPHITQKYSVQNNLFLIICVVGIMFLVIANADTGAVTVWAVYILFLLVTVTLDSKIHAIIFTIICIALEIFLVKALPEVLVTIDRSEYVSRIIIIVLSYFAVQYLTNEYALKLQGYQKFAQAQAMLEAISTNFILVNNENARDKIDKMFEMSAETLKFDQAYLVEFSVSYEDAMILNTYTIDGAMESLPFGPGMTVKTAALPMAKPLIAQGVAVSCEDVTSISAHEGDEERNYFVSRKINSYYALPIILDSERITGMLVVEYRRKRDLGDRDYILYYFGIIANILGDTKRKILYEERLYNNAYFDESSKLPNRNMLTMILDQRIKNRKGTENIAVLNIEIENLRAINDAFGHSIGENIVIKSAEILEKLLGKSYYISRSDKGAFAVLLSYTENTTQIDECANMIVDAFSNPILPKEGIEALFVAISIGVSVYPDDGKNADTLLQNADLAGYVARFSENKIVFFSKQLKSRAEENTLLTNRLFKAMQNNEFSLQFQPQISCATGKTAGVEALLRWTTIDNKKVPPDVFIPILEQTGLIYDVGLWVLESALQEHNRLIAKGFPPVRISVNLSVIQFQGKDIIRDFRKIIERNQVNPKYIELEITESVFSNNLEDIIDKLLKLKELGARISIDDFGKGYSSLNRLKMVPFNRIKIDKAIIAHIDLENKTDPITEVAILLAKAFNADVTAEGVETEEQAIFLKNIGCDEIQGYYYSKPLSASALEEFLQNE